MTRPGERRTTLRDGTVVIQKPNGQTVTLKSCGERQVTWPDGRVIIYRVNGSRVLVDAEGRQKELPPRLARESRPLNVASMSGEAIGRLLSNFAETPFTLDGLRYASVEAFYTCLLTEDESLRALLRPLNGREAKAMARKLRPTHTSYGGRRIALGSPDHHALIKRAIRAKLEQHTEIARAFALTYPRPLAHDTGRPERPGSFLPASVFVGILEELREEFRARSDQPPGP